MKKYFLGVLTGFIVCTMFVSTFAIANNPIKLIVNGNTVESDVPPQIISGRTMIPARPLAEALGAKVLWDEENSAVVVTGGIQAGATPTDLDNMPINPMAGKNALWREGFTINGKSIETDGTIDDPGIHAMGFVTPDNFYLEEEILNDILSDMGLSAVQHKCPSPDVWFNSWYFISLKDVPSINFSYDNEEMNLIIWNKSKPSPLSNKEKIEEFIPSEWVSFDELSEYGITAREEEKTGKFYLRKNNCSLGTPPGFSKNKKVLDMGDGLDGSLKIRMFNGVFYVNKKDLESFEHFKDKVKPTDDVKAE